MKAAFMEQSVSKPFSNGQKSLGCFYVSVTIMRPNNFLPLRKEPLCFTTGYFNMPNYPFQYEPVPDEMKAVVTLGEGGYDRLEYSTVKTPVLNQGDVLIKVLAAGVNNTDINTRLGWYARDVTTSTSGAEDDTAPRKDGGGWAGETPFPLIQGTDACGLIVACHDAGDQVKLGKRALIRACMRPDGFNSLRMIWMASNFDGAFATYVAVPASEAFPVATNWTDAELATIPCAYATAETMLARAGCDHSSRILVTGASGGVGSATIQLAKRRGATVFAMTRAAKAEQVSTIGADTIIMRDTDLTQQLDGLEFDIVVDNVAGGDFPLLLKTLKAGGIYASSGAIAGPIVSLDMRDLYLKDITLIGSTAWDEAVFPNLIKYIEAEEIKPLVAKQFALDDIVEAQKFFMEKQHIGNVVLIP